MKRTRPLDTLERVTEEFAKLSEADKQFSLQWLRENFQVAKTPSQTTTYQLKHFIEHIGGPYMLDAAFKGMLLAEGFKPQETDPEIGRSFFIKPKYRRWEQVPGHYEHPSYLKRLQR